MNARYTFSLIAVIVLFLIAWAGTAAGLQVVFGIIIPYLALLTFLVGFVYKVLDWSRSPVPFRIPTTAGQQKSLPWFQHAKFDCPTTRWQVVVRMALEILAFRSLFRNTRMRLKQGGKLSYQLEIFLWVGALAFHYAFFAVIFRHLRFFTDPVPFLVTLVENVDSFFRIEILYPQIHFGLPGIFMSGLVLLAAVTYLFLRRLFIRPVRYISLASDYFPLFLIFGIALQGLAETFLSPRFLEYASKQAPKGEEGLYLGYSHLTTFFANLFAFVSSGYLLDKYCPDPRTLSPEQMTTAYQHAHYIWYFYAGVGFLAFLLLMIYKYTCETIDRKKALAGD